MYFKYFDAKQHSINEAYQNRINIQVGNCSPTKKAQNKGEVNEVKNAIKVVCPLGLKNFLPKIVCIRYT